MVAEQNVFGTYKGQPLFMGAYDPLYPNGVVSIASQEHIFGIRFLLLDTETGELSAGRAMDFETIRIHAAKVEGLLDLSWQLNGKKARLRWARTDCNALYGKIDMDPGLTVCAELYVPWEYRLRNAKWVNFVRQGDCVFTGELISPYAQPPLNAIRLTVDPPPARAQGYNDRACELLALEKEKHFKDVASGNIWDSMGLYWFYGLEFREPFHFLLEADDAEAFLPAVVIQERMAAGKAKLGENFDRYFASRFRGEGIAGPIAEVTGVAMAFNAIYREDTKRRYIITDRPWARGEDDWGILFNWDTFLSSWVTSWTEPALAAENMQSCFDVQLPDGRIPLASRPRNGYAAEPPVTAGRAQHIVQGLSLWKTYLHVLDDAWLGDCYAKARRAHKWWFADRGDGQPWRDGGGLGLLGFGYDPQLEMGILGALHQPYAGKAQYAYFETYDDSPQWTDGVFFKTVAHAETVTEENARDIAIYREKSHTADIYTLERCCLYMVDCEYLEKIARVLGKDGDAQEYRAEYNRMAQKVNALMWDETDGCYYNLKFDGQLAKVQTPDCFMPLMAGIVPENRVPRLLRLLTDKNKFWGEHMIPSVAKDHASYPDQKYWRGQIWPPMVLWTYLGLKRAREDKLAWELACKAAATLAREWVQNGFYPENFNGDSGKCSGSPHYNWGTLMGLPLLEELVKVEYDRLTFGNQFAPDGLCLRGIPLDGELYDVECREGRTFVLCGGKTVAAGTGPVCIPRKRKGK